MSVLIQTLLQEKQDELERVKADFQEFRRESKLYEAALESENKLKEKELDKLSKAKDLLLTKVEELKKEPAVLNQKINELESKMKQKEGLLEDLRKRQVEMEEEISDLENKTRILEFERNELNDKVSKLLEENALLTDELNEKVGKPSEEVNLQNPQGQIPFDHDHPQGQGDLQNPQTQTPIDNTHPQGQMNQSDPQGQVPFDSKQPEKQIDSQYPQGMQTESTPDVQNIQTSSENQAVQAPFPTIRQIELKVLEFTWEPVILVPQQKLRFDEATETMVISCIDAHSQTELSDSQKHSMNKENESQGHDQKGTVEVVQNDLFTGIEKFDYGLPIGGQEAVHDIVDVHPHLLSRLKGPQGGIEKHYETIGVQTDIPLFSESQAKQDKYQGEEALEPSSKQQNQPAATKTNGQEENVIQGQENFPHENIKRDIELKQDSFDIIQFEPPLIKQHQQQVHPGEQQSHMEPQSTSPIMQEPDLKEVYQQLASGKEPSNEDFLKLKSTILEIIKTIPAANQTNSSHSPPQGPQEHQNLEVIQGSSIQEPQVFNGVEVILPQYAQPFSYGQVTDVLDFTPSYPPQGQQPQSYQQVSPRSHEVVPNKPAQADKEIQTIYIEIREVNFLQEEAKDTGYQSQVMSQQSSGQPQDSIIKESVQGVPEPQLSSLTPTRPIMLDEESQTEDSRKNDDDKERMGNIEEQPYSTATPPISQPPKPAFSEIETQTEICVTEDHLYQYPQGLTSQPSQELQKEELLSLMLEKDVQTEICMEVLLAAETQTRQGEQGNNNYQYGSDHAKILLDIEVQTESNEALVQNSSPFTQEIQSEGQISLQQANGQAKALLNVETQTDSMEVSVENPSLFQGQDQINPQYEVQNSMLSPQDAQLQTEPESHLGGIEKVTENKGVTAEIAIQTDHLEWLPQTSLSPQDLQPQDGSQTNGQVPINVSSLKSSAEKDIQTDPVYITTQPNERPKEEILVQSKFDPQQNDPSTYEQEGSQQLRDLLNKDNPNQGNPPNERQEEEQREPELVEDQGGQQQEQKTYAELGVQTESVPKEIPNHVQSQTENQPTDNNEEQKNSQGIQSQDQINQIQMLQNDSNTVQNFIREVSEIAIQTEEILVRFKEEGQETLMPISKSQNKESSLGSIIETHSIEQQTVSISRKDTSSQTEETKISHKMAISPKSIPSNLRSLPEEIQDKAEHTGGKKSSREFGVQIKPFMCNFVTQTKRIELQDAFNQTMKASLTDSSTQHVQTIISSKDTQTRILTNDIQIQVITAEPPNSSHKVYTGEETTSEIIHQTKHHPQGQQPENNEAAYKSRNLSPGTGKSQIRGKSNPKIELNKMEKGEIKAKWEQGTREMMKSYVNPQGSCALPPKAKAQLESPILPSMRAYRMTGGPTCELVCKEIRKEIQEGLKMTHISDSDGEEGRNEGQMMEEKRVISFEGITTQFILHSKVPELEITGNTLKLAQQSYKFDVIQQIEQDGDIAGLNVPYEFPRNELHILEGPKKSKKKQLVHILLISYLKKMAETLETANYNGFKARIRITHLDSHEKEVKFLKKNMLVDYKPCVNDFEIKSYEELASTFTSIQDYFANYFSGGKMKVFKKTKYSPRFYAIELTTNIQADNDKGPKFKLPERTAPQQTMRSLIFTSNRIKEYPKEIDDEDALVTFMLFHKSENSWQEVSYNAVEQFRKIQPRKPNKTLYMMTSKNSSSREIQNLLGSFPFEMS